MASLHFDFINEEYPTDQDSIQFLETILDSENSFDYRYVAMLFAKFGVTNYLYKYACAVTSTEFKVKDDSENSLRYYYSPIRYDEFFSDQQAHSDQFVRNIFLTKTENQTSLWLPCNSIVIEEGKNPQVAKKSVVHKNNITKVQQGLRFYIDQYVDQSIYNIAPTFKDLSFRIPNIAELVLVRLTNNFTKSRIFIDKSELSLDFITNMIEQFRTSGTTTVLIDFEKEYLDGVLNTMKGICLTFEFDTDQVENLLAETDKYINEHPEVDQYRDYVIASFLSQYDTISTIYENVKFDIPDPAIRYVTQKTDNNLLELYQWCSMQFLHTIDKHPEVDPVVDLSVIAKGLESLTTSTVKNEDDIIIDSKGTLLYVPTLTLSTYQEYVKNMRNDSIIEIDKDTLLFDPSICKGVSRQILYTDWTLDKLVYTTIAGTISLHSLSGVSMADDISYYNNLNCYYSEDKVIDAMALLFGYAKKKNILEYFKLSDFELLIKPDRLQDFKSFSSTEKDLKVVVDAYLPNLSLTEFIQNPSIVNFVSRIYCAINDRAFYDSDFEYTIDLSSLLISDVVKLPFFQFIKRICKDVIDELEQDGINEFLQNNWKVFGVLRCLETIAFAKCVLKDQIALSKNFTEITNNYTLSALTRDTQYKVLPTPNIKKGMMLLPHQVQVDHKLSLAPENAVIHVEAGGGKTLLTILAILKDLNRLHSKNHTPRICVVCPNYLMQNYIEDTIFATHGKLNVIPVTTQTFNDLGYEGTLNLINSAPLNSFVIIGINIFSVGKDIEINYLGTKVRINQIVETLRSIKWDAIYIDESHLFANNDSIRSKNLLRLIPMIKYRRIESGTIVNSTMADAFGQSKILSPNIFSSIDTFNLQYALSMRGSRVTSWQPNAEIRIRGEMGKLCDYMYVPRKEWAALLPHKDERFHFVDLDPLQRKIYIAILDSIIDELKKDPYLRAKLESGDESEAEILEGILKQFLAPLERFLTAPDKNKAGKELPKESRISPKIHKINEILEEHFSDPDLSKGKVLIFTNYLDSAESIYEHLAPKFQRMALHYVASKKSTLLPIMKKDKNVRIVIGVENSLNTGHNFQDYSRLIRVENCWNPGTLEQADSRLNRPNVKNKETRKSITIDYVLANNTLDVTKMARLIGKMISKAKFDNPYSLIHQNLVDLPLVSMTFENINQRNNFDKHLLPYLEAYQDFKSIEKQEFEEFLSKTKHKSPVEIPIAKCLPGSRLIKVPYISNMVLPYQDELGLENLADVALKLNISIYDLSLKYLKNAECHTQDGDGIIIKVNKNSVTVRLKKEVKSYDKTSVFLKTRQIGDTFKALQKKIGFSYDCNSSKESSFISSKVIKSSKILKQYLKVLSKYKLSKYTTESLDACLEALKHGEKKGFSVEKSLRNVKLKNFFRIKHTSKKSLRVYPMIIKSKLFLLIDNDTNSHKLDWKLHIR